MSYSGSKDIDTSWPQSNTQVRTLKCARSGCSKAVVVACDLSQDGPLPQEILFESWKFVSRCISSPAVIALIHRVRIGLGVEEGDEAEIHAPQYAVSIQLLYERPYSTR